MPYHEHDCDRCRFICSYPDDTGTRMLDLYRSCDKLEHSYIIRWGEYGDYRTVSNMMPLFPLCLEKEYRA